MSFREYSIERLSTNSFIISPLKQRDKIIDLMKGILICLMVIGHSGAPEFIVKWIYSFHMPLFFFLSGYCFDEKHYANLNQLKEYIRKQFSRLYIPYVITNASFLFFNNFFVDFGVCINYSTASEPSVGGGQHYVFTHCRKRCV